MSNIFEDSEIIIVKIGSSLLVDSDGNLRLNWLHSLSEDIAALKAEGKQVLIVTSGSVGLGMNKLSNDKPKIRLKLKEKQAAAACGQVTLMNAFQKVFMAHDLDVAQILLTIDDSENRRRYMNAKNTLNVLLREGIIPVINENDTVATRELRVGDNDRLAARVAQMVSADCLVLLSDVDGLYTANPREDDSAKHIDEVESITKNIEAMADGAGSNVGTGGMITKVIAAKIAMASGCSTMITDGEAEHPIAALQQGAVHTLFKASVKPTSARKQWIAHSLTPRGRIIVDKGAEKALYDGNSLLPVGITHADGEFDRGDTVLVENREGEKLGFGLTNHTQDEVKLILGRGSEEIDELLGYSGPSVVIHRNDLVLEKS